MIEAEIKFYLIAVPEDFEIESFNRLEELLEALRRRRKDELDAPVHTRHLMFLGNRLYLTKGDYKYLVTPKEQIPLLAPPESVELDELGCLVDIPNKLENIDDPGSSKQDATVAKKTEPAAEDPFLAFMSDDESK